MVEDHDHDVEIESKNTTTSSPTTPPPTTTTTSSPLTTITTTLTTTRDRRSLRAYSKKHRVYVFREFLLETYQSYLQSSSSLSDNNNINNTNESIVLDIAGGKGDLSWLLIHFDNYNNNTNAATRIRSIVIDPRPSGTSNHIQRTVQFLLNNPMECQIRSVRNKHTYQPIASLLVKQQQQHKQHTTNKIDINSDLHKPEHIKIHVSHILVTAVQQYVQQFTTKHDAIQYIRSIDPTTTTSSNNNDKYLIEWNNYWSNATCSSSSSSITAEKDIQDKYVICNSINVLQVILQCKLIIGFHPDQATDSCIDLANVLHIPFAIVPCCVYPTEFSHRQFLFFNQYYNSNNDNYENDNNDVMASSSSNVNLNHKKNNRTKKNHNNNKKNNNDLKLVFCQPINTVVVDNKNENNDNNDTNINDYEESALLSMIDEQQEQLHRQLTQLTINNTTTTNNDNETKDCEEEKNNNINTNSATTTSLSLSLSSSSSAAYSSYPVKRYADLLLYLYQKCPTSRIHRKILPFEGTITAKNIVLYTLPPLSSSPLPSPSLPN